MSQGRPAPKHAEGHRQADQEPEALQWLFWRYATYNGSDVRFSHIGCIAHVELALGAME